MHTPGPWKIRKDDRYNHAYGIEKNKKGLRSIIALINDQWLCEEHGDLVANARLIAAAPDLLEACEEALKIPDIPMRYYSVIMQAIAKAKPE